MNELIEHLKWALIEAEKHKSGDKAMEYAYKYGLLMGTIKSAIIDLEYFDKENANRTPS